MILTDDKKPMVAQARPILAESVDHMVDHFDMGWNYYMLPEIAAKGLVLMLGIDDHNDDLSENTKPVYI